MGHFSDLQIQWSTPPERPNVKKRRYRFYWFNGERLGFGGPIGFWIEITPNKKNFMEQTIDWITNWPILAE